MNKRTTVLRLIQIPGGTDGFKVNRGDFRRRHGHMSTSNTVSGGGLKRGAMVCEDERQGSCAGYRGAVLQLQLCFLSLSDLCDKCLLLLRNSVSHLWLAAIHQWEDEPGKRAAEEIKPAILQMHRDYQLKKIINKKSHVRQFTSSRSNIHQTNSLHLTTSAIPGSCSHWNQYEEHFTSGPRRPFTTPAIYRCHCEEIFHRLKAL